MFSIRSIASVCSLLLIACAHGGVHTDRIGDARTKVVAVLWPSVHTTPLTPGAWRASPWYRDFDIVTPSRVVIATDRSACIMRDGDVREPRATEAFTCADDWRYFRQRGR